MLDTAPALQNLSKLTKHHRTSGCLLYTSTEKYLADAPAAFDEVEADPNMEKLWQAYQKKFSYAADLSWYTVMESIRNLYRRVQ